MSAPSRASTVTTAAIRGEPGTTISRSTAYANVTPAGITVGLGGTVSHCAARANTSAAVSSVGISGGEGSTIIACTAEGNLSTAATLTGRTGGGIIGSVMSVFDCTVMRNVGDGIFVTGNCHVRGNTCITNGNPTGDAAGIHANSFGNRIEGNTVANNDRGVDVDVAGNFIVRNTARTNTSNYEIIAGNFVGAIVLPPPSAAISGSTGGAGVGSTDPWANFSL